MIAPDTSVVVPALLAWHEAHARADAALADEVVLLAHVELEAYSTLTRLPPPVRLDPSAVATALGGRFPGPRPALPANDRGRLIAQLAEAGIAGGAAYDGLIALTAYHCGCTLLTADRRAEHNYGALGADVRWLDEIR